MVLLRSEMINIEIEKILSSQKELVNNEKNIKDLTNLKTYAIDDLPTDEIDDALSLEVDNGTYYIWIHIAEPTRVIHHDSAIDIQARERGTSIYMTEGVIPMLPQRITEEVISLKQNKLSSTISTRIELNDKGDIVHYKVLRGIIKTNYCLTYDEADDLIGLAPREEIDLFIISEILTRRYINRGNNGAVNIEQTQGRIYLLDGIPTLKVIEHTPSRRMISEAMILAGTIIAKFAIENNIPIIFRGQLKSELPGNLELLHNSCLKNFELIRNLKRAFYTTKPTPHFSLGLDSYVQSTSPIRRYSDMLVQKQIHNFLEGEYIFTEEELGMYLSGIKIKIEEAVVRTRENQKIWINKFIIKNINSRLKATFIRWLREREKIALVYLEEYCLVTSIYVDSTNSPVQGDRMEIRVSEELGYDNEPRLFIS